MTTDDALLTLLRAAAANVWDGDVDADETLKVVAVPLPFVLYFGKSTIPTNRRAGGRADRGAVASMTCAGITREQADWLADRVEAALDGKPIGKRTVRFDDRDGPRKDPKYSRPGGGPLFYTALKFTV